MSKDSQTKETSRWIKYKGDDGKYYYRDNSTGKSYKWVKDAPFAPTAQFAPVKGFKDAPFAPTAQFAPVKGFKDAPFAPTAQFAPVKGFKDAPFAPTEASPDSILKVTSSSTATSAMTTSSTAPSTVAPHLASSMVDQAMPLAGVNEENNLELTGEKHD